MKSFKFISKLLFFVCVLSANTTAQAQGFHFGVQAGGNAATIIEKTDVGDKIDKDLKFGFQLGAMCEYEVMSFLSVGVAAVFFQKGDKINDEFATSKASIGSIDIPITIAYMVPIGNVKIGGVVGPYTSISVVGKRSFVVTETGVEPQFEWNFEENGHDAYADNSTEFYGEEWNSFKRFDSGITCGLKLYYSKYQLGVTYSRGFIDIRPNETITAKSSVINLSLVYLIK